MDVQAKKLMKINIYPFLLKMDDCLKNVIIAVNKSVSNIKVWEILY